MASVEVLKNPIKPRIEIVRPIANFPPSIWGGLFLSFHVDNQISETYGKEIVVLKEEVRSMIVSKENKFEEMLILIDTMERLGFSYHFEEQIEKELEKTLTNIKEDDIINDYDLYTTALHFRLLRQHGYHVSSRIFYKFLDNKGKFQQTLNDDVKGLLSLYEAAHARTHGEEVLDEALAFATTHLEYSIPNLMESSLKKQVLHALGQCLHKGIPRIEAIHFISIYEEDESKNEVLLRLAKLDFNMLQMLHKKELSDISRWWKEQDLIAQLSYPRDRVVECYFWACGTFCEPQHSTARIILTKAITITSIIDDTFDAYGTIDELQVFTEAVQRWDISEIDRLPDYMKIIYGALLNLFQAYYEEVAPEGRSYAVHHAKEMMKDLVRGYYIEAKWFLEGCIPPFAEYYKNGKITSAHYLLTPVSFIGMNASTKEVFDWLLTKPKILEANVIICRMVDDTATYLLEKGRGQIFTAIECYMKENGVSGEKAVEDIHQMAENAWKDLNGSLKETCVPKEFLIRILNLSRMIEVVYKHDKDGYTHPEKLLKPYIVALFVDSFKV